MGGRSTPTSGAYNESHVYDANTDSWSTADILNVSRYGHTAVLYPVSGSDNDRVLAAGGIGSGDVPASSAERYTP